MELQDDGIGYPSPEEIKQFCRIGAGADCCIWLMVGKRFECNYFRRPSALVERWKKGLTNAKRDGCDMVKSLANPPEIKIVKAKTLKDMLSEKTELMRGS